MTHPIIKTDNYLLVLDESEIKDTNWMYYKHFGEDIVCKYDRMNGKNTNVNEHKPFYQKIIYHLPLNNAPTLEGVPLLPPLDEAEHLVIPNIYIQSFDEFGEPKWDEGKLYHRQQGFIEGYKKGYNKAKEKYKYTEEDMRKAFQCGQQWVHEITNTDKDPTNFNELIQSLQYPVAFESAMGTIDDGFLIVDVPKTITNSEGLTQLVGKYIY